eukprot:SAG31_NODE_2369_length_5854_cov_3.778454_1_plen_251_part_10
MQPAPFPFHRCICKWCASSLLKGASIAGVEPRSLPVLLEMCLLQLLWGLANNLNDILMKQFRKAFELGNLEVRYSDYCPVSSTGPFCDSVAQHKVADGFVCHQASLVQTALFIGYFIGAPPAAALAHRTSYKVTICVGLALYSSGAVIFYPAGEFRWYPLFLAALLVIGLGLACLETSVSPYLLRLGRLETAQRRINFAAVFNPIGSVIGVLIGRNLVLSGVEHTHCSCDALAADSGASCGILVTFNVDKI